MDRLSEVAAVLKACGHPLRLKLLCAIEKGEEACVSELWNCLEQSQPVVSQHLAVLKKCGIVASQAKGNRRVYTVVDPFVRELIETLHRTLDDGRGRSGKV